jgi:hypothetical protein
METPLSLKVDLGIAETVGAVDAIIARWQNRETEVLSDFLSNLDDALDATTKIVNKLDDLFVDLVRGFADREIIDNQVLLQTHVKETRKYLQKRDLLPRLEQCIGAISGAAVDPRLAGRAYREMVSTLRSLVARLTEYRNQLGRGGITGVGQLEHWNLETLCEHALGYQYGGGTIKKATDEIAEEVLRNHDFDLSDSVHRLIGKARIHAKTSALG